MERMESETVKTALANLGTECEIFGSESGRKLVSRAGRAIGTSALALHLVLHLILFVAAPTVSQAGTTPPPPVSEPPPAPKLKLMEPEYSFLVKDGKILAQIFGRNAWFQNFRQTSFYQGFVQRLAPVIFSPPDEHGPQANSWKGRLLDHLYEQLLSNRPMTLHYYRRSDLSSPFVISVSGLNQAEITATQGLIQALKSAEPLSIEVEESRSVAVTPLLVKQQKFAAVLNEGCLTVGRSAKAVASASVICKPGAKLAGDAELHVNLNESFPALASVREKFLGVMPLSRVNFKWNASESKLVPLQSETELLAEQHLLLKEAIPSDLLKAVPAGAVFFSAGFVPLPKSGFAPSAIQSYFKEAKNELKKEKPLPVALVYLGLDRTNERSARALPALLIRHPNPTAAVITQISQTFSGGRTEVFVRKACNNVIAISNKAEALNLIEQVCARKEPSLEQLPEKTLAGLKSGPLSAAVLVSPGKLLSIYIDKGWRAKKSEAMPEELRASRNLVEQLPSYLFTGLADQKKLLLKASL